MGFTFIFAVLRNLWFCVHRDGGGGSIPPFFFFFFECVCVYTPDLVFDERHRCARFFCMMDFVFLFFCAEGALVGKKKTSTDGWMVLEEKDGWMSESGGPGGGGGGLVYVVP